MERMFLIYAIEDNDLIEKCKIKGNFIFNKDLILFTRNKEDEKLYNFGNNAHINLYELKDERIIILCNKKVFIITINDN